MTYIRYFATNRDRENLGRDVSRRDRLKMQKGGYNWIDTTAYMSYYLAETNPDRMPKEALITSSQQPIFDDFLGKLSVKRVIICIHGFNVPLHGALTSFTVLADTLKATGRFGDDPDDSDLIVDPTTEEAKAKLANPENKLTAVVGFSWPSNGSVLDYGSDRTEAATSAPVLANLISAIRHQKAKTEKIETEIFVVAHSMGNFLTCTMLHDLAEEKYTPLFNEGTQQERLKFRGDKDIAHPKFFIEGYFMLAPDVERRHVTKCYKVPPKTGFKSDPYRAEDFSKEALTQPQSLDNEIENLYYLGPFFEGLHHLVGGTYLFYSRHDQALKTSRIEKEVRERSDDLKELLTGRNMDNLWEDSLGLNPVPPLAPPNMYSINSSTCADMAIDHGNYFDVMGIAQKIAQKILEYRAA